MIYGREIKGYHWRVFQHGHMGWWFTDGRGVVCRQAYETCESATIAMNEEKK